MANIRKITDKDGNVILPITVDTAILSEDGTSLTSKYATKDYVDNKIASGGTVNSISIVLGNYTIQYNETNDTLDFLYNGVIEESETPTTTLTWVVGNLDSSGAEIVQDSTLRSDYVAIKDGYNYSFYLDPAMSNPTGVRVYFYDSDKTFISRTDGVDLGYTTDIDIPIDIPTNAAYIRMKSNINSTTTLDNINTLLTLRATISYIASGLSLYIDAEDTVLYGSIRDVTGTQTITNNGVSTVLDNSCLKFVQSESDYIDGGFIPNLTTWTMEIYFYMDDDTTDQTLCGWGASGNRVSLCYWPDTSTQLLISPHDETEIYKMGSLSNYIGTLNHLVITMDNGILTSYINGVTTGLATNAAVLTSHTNTLKLGVRYSASSQFTNMHLSTFRFYDGKVLTEKQAKHNYEYVLNRNIINPTWIDNAYIESDGTVVGNDPACMSSAYISKIDNYNYTINYSNVDGLRLVFYDNTKTLISRTDYLTTGNTDAVITFPDNTAYFRIKANKLNTTVDEVNSNIIIKKVIS